MFEGYPFAVSLIDLPRKAAVTPNVSCSAQGPTIIVSELPIFAPFLVQMTVVHEPSFQLLQFTAHLPPLFSKVPCFCALLFRELAILGSSLRESRQALLGPWASGGPSMELTAPHRESSRPLAQGTPTGPKLAPLTLPVWAVEPWFGVGFHYAQISTVQEVLLYYNLGRVTRHAWLGPRTSAWAKPSNAH